MTIQQLQYIVALDTHRHFVKAAESCMVAQPTLTLQVKKLEEEIGMSLFDRSAKPIIPTPMGKQFIQKARVILHEVASLKEMVNDDKEGLEGTYRLGIIPTLAPYLLPRFIKKFCDANPKINLEIKEIQSIDIIKSLKSNQLDIGIMATPLEDNAIREMLLFYEPFLVYAGEGHPLLEKEEVSPEDIVPEGLWLLNEGHCFRNQVLNICNKTGSTPAHPSLKFESGSIETIKNIVLNDLGYSLIPELAVNNKLDKQLVRRFKNPRLTREISVVTHVNFTKELLLTRLKQTIVDNLPSNFRKIHHFVTVRWK